jgi:hypothetical protein
METTDRGWYFHVWLRLLFRLASSAAILTALLTPASATARLLDAEASETRSEQVLVATEGPRAVLAQAQRWRERGTPFPDALLRKAVEAALQPEAPWDDITAAITAFDAYQDRPWLTQVMQPFVVYNATNILLNADMFARMHRAWAQRAVEMAAPQAPGFVLGALQILATLDPVWAKQLATTVTTTAPGIVWAHVDVLLAVDTSWTEGLLRQAVSVSPYDAIRAVSVYKTAPWGTQLFADVVLREPRLVIRLMAADPARHEAVGRALDEATHPALHVLAQIVHSHYPDDLKERMAVLAEVIAAQILSLEAAAQLSSDEHTYFQTLVAMHLRDPRVQQHALEMALGEKASALAEEMNNLLEQPAAARFHAVTTWTAREIYCLIVYGEAEMFTSSYRGVFDRLIARMHQEALTGDALLSQVRDTRFRIFIKSAAMLNRLAMFLATIPSPVARWSLLTRCMSDLERAPDVAVQAVTAAEMLSAPLDPASLRLIRDTLRSEYARAESEHNQQARIIYGLLIAALVQRHATELTDPALRTIADTYLPALPARTGIPLAGLFQQGTNIQKYFFYNDDDGKLSFQSFMAQYRHDKAWQIEDHGSFVHLRSTLSARTIEIYANKFTEDEQGSTDIDEVLRQRKLTPSVIVHRGHSTYVAQTLKNVPATAALVYLGNCGSYTLLETVLGKAPQAHILTTKGIGTLAINDPLLKALNDYFLRGKDMTWQSFWRQAEATLGQNPRFMDYVPPDKNAGAAFLTAYRSFMTTK